MDYIKNIDLAEMYTVSPNTIGNWIDAALEKKLNLQLIKINDRHFIKDNEHNHLIMQELVQKGKKFKNLRSLIKVAPSDDFYKIYSESQIIEIINALDLYKEIPHKYSYFNGGAEKWDEYVNRCIEENTKDNGVLNDIELLEWAKFTLKEIISDRKKINIIDLGVGNGKVMSKFVQYFKDLNLLNKYIGIDYSQSMLDLWEKNVRNVFGDSIVLESHCMDFFTQSIRDILFKSTEYNEDKIVTSNLVMLVGGTFNNTVNSLNVIKSVKMAMGKHDLLILSESGDNDKVKLNFNFSSKDTIQEESIDKTDKYKIIDQEKLILDQMNIKEEFYDIEAFYNKESNSRIIQIRLNIDLEIHFKTPHFTRLVKLNNRDAIKLLRIAHSNFAQRVQILNDIGFKLEHLTTSKNGLYRMLITKPE